VKITFLFLLVLVSIRSTGQVRNGIRLREEQAYKTDIEMTKVIVCTDDRSVWALSADGRVFYKLNNQADFSEFAATSGIVVTDLTGYSQSEMYFQAGTDGIYYTENGALRLLNTSGMIGISGIAVVNARRNETLAGHQGRRDWLAITSREAVYSVFRTDAAKTPVSYLQNEHSEGAVPQWRITNSGFKSIDFQFQLSANMVCFGPTEHAYYSKINGSEFWSKATLPEAGEKFTPDVNCTYFENSFNEVIDADNRGLQFWGTDKGLYARLPGTCGPDANFRKLDNIKINDLENLNILKNLYNRRFMMIATDDGLYYITSMLYLSEHRRVPSELELTNMEILKLPIDAGKVRSIATEIYSNPGQVTADSYQLCEKTVWLATEKGIRKVTVDPALFTSVPFYDRFFIRAVQVNPYVSLCEGTDVKFGIRLTDAERGRLSIQWYKGNGNYSNPQEMTEWRDREQIALSEPGFYGYRLTDQCEGHVVVSDGIEIRKEPGPNVTFNPPPEVSLCEDRDTTFVTEFNSSYVYQWIKDDRPIPGATANAYTVKEVGVYRVEVKNCGEVFMPSSNVKVSKTSFAVPVITRSSTKTLCFGETVRLSAPVQEGATYLWSNNETGREMVAHESGNYTVEMKVGADCGKVSLPELVTVKEELKLTKPPEVTICELRNQKLRLMAAPGFTFYTWDGVRGSADYLDVSQTGSYLLEVEDESGCTAVTNYIVVPYCSPPLPPTAFSPNGDGINDTWTVGGLEGEPTAEIRVYNRYGMTVFEGNIKNAGWDGKCNGGDAPAGVYYYVVTKKTSKPSTGTVTLIR
jgi:gliding motility-associated-like protein